MSATVKILIPYPAPSSTPERAGKYDMAIPYKINDSGTFTVRVPLESYTAAEGEKAVRQQAGQQAALVDKTFTL